MMVELIKYLLHAKIVEASPVNIQTGKVPYNKGYNNRYNISFTL